MTDKPALPPPTGWVVMKETKGGPHFVVPAWIHRDGDGDSIIIIGHPGGVIVGGQMNPDLGSVELTAWHMLAACQASSDQRLYGQAAVERLLESIRPEGDTTTLEDLIKRGVEETEQRDQQRSASYTQLSDLFASLHQTLDDLSRRNRPDDQSEGGES